MKGLNLLVVVLSVSFSLYSLPSKFQGRSICDKDDMTFMINEPADIQEMGTPIGIWKIKDDGLCTGTLIGKDLFLTAQHCSGDCKKIEVTFGYLKNGRRQEETFACKEILEVGNGDLKNDYLIARLEGNPGANLGWYDVSSEKLKKDQALLMIHHPGGSPMKVSRKNCHVYEQTDEFVQHKCDTLPGSSGSGILLPDFSNPKKTKIVGVHTLGGCSSNATSYNSGPSMRHLVEVSPLLKSLDKK